jgi:signal transduction histidine kinase
LHDAVQALRYLDIVAYLVLGVVTLRFWVHRRDRASMWAAIAFGSLAALLLLGLIPNNPGNLVERGIGRVAIALIVVFPYLLFRFTNAFRTPHRRLAEALVGLTVILVVWTFALPSIPQPGEARGAAFEAFVVAFVIHWTILSVVSALSLWRAGRAQPTVARRRMQFLALGTAAITLAVVLALPTNQGDGLKLGSSVLATLSVLWFVLGFAPPPLLRMLWRAPEQRRLQDAIAGLLTFAESQEEVASRVLEPAAGIVGARAIAIRNADGRIVAAWNVPPAPFAEADVLDLEVPGGSLVVWTSPYAPFFGDEELRLLGTLGALTGLALDRVRAFQAEREAHMALERANELKTSFVALAAHELRTPVTTIHGFVHTLHRLGDRLSPGEQAELRVALEQQTARMVSLVEQLLDLSRLDADAIDIAPQPLRVRERVEDVVRAAAAARADVVEIDVAPELETVADPNAFERILTNLVTNALNYGEPPVIVRAEQTDRHFRLSVEDRGRGVAPEFVPDLFERFTRSERSGERRGTGLGLAIAQSYARAHDGELVYEAAQPHGARFKLVLPARTALRAPRR